MYQKRFELHRRPFQSVQRDGDHFLSESYSDLRANVKDVLKSDSGVVVLTGPSGVGKTVALEALRQELEQDNKTLLIRGGTVRSQDDFLYVLHRFLLKSDAEEASSVGINAVRRCDVLERLERLAEFWGPLTILLDDVHLVQSDVFAELRMLLEENAAGQRLGRLMIAGPLSLEEILAQTDMIDFARRIRAHVFLEPLRTAESVAYVKHHFENAGGNFSRVFSPKSVEQIVVAAGGVPRCLNLLADETLIICEETDQSSVTPEIVNTALGRLQHLAVAWNALASDSEKTEDSSSTESVVEIGGPIEVSEGVIEIGGPAPQPAAPRPALPNAVGDIAEPETCDVSQTTAAPSDTEVEWLEEPEVELGCCEFVEDDDALRDTSVIQQINELAVSLQEIEAQDVPTPENKVTEAPIDNSPEPDETRIDACDEHAVTAADDDPQPAGDSGDDKTDKDVDSLEHHLLLAANTSATITGDFLAGVNSSEDVEPATMSNPAAVDEAQVASADNEEEISQSPTESISQENERIFEVILERATRQESENEPILTSFSAWNPAGSWPVSVDTPQETELPEQDMTFASAEEPHAEEQETAAIDHTIEADIPQEPVTSDRAIYAVQLGNASPVFDRYTWSELGRGVSAASPPHRNLPEQIRPPAWPADVEGIAPDDTIHVESVDEMTELDFEATSATAIEPFDNTTTQSDASTEQLSSNRDSTPWTMMPLSEGVFEEETDELPSAESVDFEVVSLPVPADSIEFASDSEESRFVPEAEDDEGVDQHEPVAVTEEEESNSDLTDDQEAIIAAVSRTLQNTPNGPQIEGSEDVAAVIANVVQRFIGQPQTSDDRGPSPGAQQQLVAETEDELLIGT